MALLARKPSSAPLLNVLWAPVPPTCCHSLTLQPRLFLIALCGSETIWTRSIRRPPSVRLPILAVHVASSESSSSPLSRNLWTVPASDGSLYRSRTSSRNAVCWKERTGSVNSGRTRRILGETILSKAHRDSPNGARINALTRVISDHPGQDLVSAAFASKGPGGRIPSSPPQVVLELAQGRLTGSRPIA